MSGRKPGWKEIPRGALILEAGNAAQYHTGDWRSRRPLWNEGVCTHCLLCWVYCPDSAVEVAEGKMKGINLDYCKGCGICANQCPKAGALTMADEDAEPARA